jgi:hypothetical protein
MSPFKSKKTHGLKNLLDWLVYLLRTAKTTKIGLSSINSKKVTFVIIFIALFSRNLKSRKRLTLFAQEPYM